MGGWVGGWIRRGGEEKEKREEDEKMEEEKERRRRRRRRRRSRLTWSFWSVEAWSLSSTMSIEAIRALKLRGAQSSSITVSTHHQKQVTSCCLCAEVGGWVGGWVGG